MTEAWAGLRPTLASIARVQQMRRVGTALDVGRYVAGVRSDVDEPTVSSEYAMNFSEDARRVIKVRVGEEGDHGIE